MMLFAGGWSFLNRFFIIMLKQSGAQSYLPGAAKEIVTLFKFFYVHSVTITDVALRPLEPSSSENTSGELKQNCFLFYRIYIFMHF